MTLATDHKDLGNFLIDVDEIEMTYPMELIHQNCDDIKWTQVSRQMRFVLNFNLEQELKEQECPEFTWRKSGFCLRASSRWPRAAWGRPWLRKYSDCLENITIIKEKNKRLFKENGSESTQTALRVLQCLRKRKRLFKENGSESTQTGCRVLQCLRKRKVLIQGYANLSKRNGILIIEI